KAWMAPPAALPASVWVTNSPQSPARRRQLDAGILDPPRNRKAAQALAVAPTKRREPAGPLLHDVADPEQRFDVLLQCRPAEQADLGNVRRAMARQAAFAFDRFDHGGLFTADIGAGAAAKLKPCVFRQPRPLDLGKLVGEHEANFRIFVAQVDVSLGGLDHPGSNQHALDETVRIALQIVAILEGAGLTLVGIDGHQPRRRLGPHQGPLAAGRNAGTAEPTQAGIADRPD